MNSTAFPTGSCCCATPSSLITTTSRRRATCTPCGYCLAISRLSSLPYRVTSRCVSSMSRRPHLPIYRAGKGICPSTEFLEKAVPKLLSMELDKFGLATADDKGVKRLMANRGLREEETIGPMTALFFSEAAAVIEFLNLAAAQLCLMHL